MFRSRTLAAVAAVAFLAAGGAAQAQSKAFKITGSGSSATGLPLPGQPDATHTITGNATHLGLHTGSGDVHVEAVTSIDPVTGVIGGIFGSGTPYVFTAANGDKLVTLYGRDGPDYVGTFTLTPVDPLLQGPGQLYVAEFVAEFVVQPDASTGHFAGVTGSWTMFAVTDPFRLGVPEPLDYSWEGRGRLTFPSDG
jgi:hypothetical protein